jgi:hypothetical protein
MITDKCGVGWMFNCAIPNKRGPTSLAAGDEGHFSPLEMRGSSRRWI